MKLSSEQARRVLRYAGAHPTATRKKPDFSDGEIRLMREMLKQMPERSFRHINYDEIRRQAEGISPSDVAEKVLMKNLVDGILGEPPSALRDGRKQ